MKGRNIAYNIRKAIDVMQYAEDNKISGVAISLDFEKTFDSVEKCAIRGAMEFFNFGEKLIRWILLYVDFEACTINAGYASEWFFPTRGLHQGAPKAPIIFLLVSEVLGMEIRKNDIIEGIPINDKVNIKSGQFADDTILFSLFKVMSVQAIVDTLTKFEGNTGLRLNYKKSNVYRIGSLARSDARLYTTKVLNWTSEKVNLVGN